MGQRLQRQGNAWQSELDAWVNVCKPGPVEEARARLGCGILIKFCDLLHARMFESNSESLAIRDRSQTVPHRNGIDCSLLLSVTDKLPSQTGSDGNRYCFPIERQLKQPQMDEDITRLTDASSPSLLKSAALEELLTENSFDGLKRKCEGLGITALGKLNRLRMAESILFHQSARQSRQSPELEGGKVLSCMVCRVVTVLTSASPHR